MHRRAALRPAGGSGLPQAGRRLFLMYCVTDRARGAVLGGGDGVGGRLRGQWVWVHPHREQCLARCATAAQAAEETGDSSRPAPSPCPHHGPTQGARQHEAPKDCCWSCYAAETGSWVVLWLCLCDEM